MASKRWIGSHWSTTDRRARIVVVSHYSLVRDDAVLSVRDWGGDAPPLVLVHGLGANQRDWDSIGVKLAGQFRVITYDQRGHGGSTRSADYSWAARVDDLSALLSEMDLHSVTLVGHSLGAGVALMVAGAIADCRGLVLIDGALPAQLPVPYGKEPGHRVRNILVRITRAAGYRVRGNGPMSFADLSMIGDDYRTRAEEFDRALHTVACPTLYLVGSRTERGPTGPAFQNAREAAAARAVAVNPLVRVQWVDARHNMIRTHAREVASDIAHLAAEPR